MTTGLFLAERVERDDFRRRLGGLRRGVRGGFGGVRRGFEGRRLELQAKLDGRIEEPLNRVERYDELFGNVVEGELDLELGLVNGKIPKLVLQHDRHFLWVTLAQPLR